MLTNHIDLTHNYWHQFLKKGDIAIDATCGNGLDSLFLAQTILQNGNGKLFCFDIQQEAITNTHDLLKKNLSQKDFSNVEFLLQSHEDLSIIKNQPIKLIVYNLGYLPKGDKSLTTMTKTTLLSIKSAMDHLSSIGAISLTCYPGHEEGKKEEKALIDFLSALPSQKWHICYHKWINRQNSPTLLWIERKRQTSTTTTLSSPYEV